MNGQNHGTEKCKGLIALIAEWTSKRILWRAFRCTSCGEEYRTQKSIDGARRA